MYFCVVSTTMTGHFVLRLVGLSMIVLLIVCAIFGVFTRSELEGGGDTRFKRTIEFTKGKISNSTPIPNAVHILPVPLKGDSLYSDDRYVVNLENHNFNSSVFHHNHAHLVEFYSSYCGHCIHFAPIYKEFAESISGWTSTVYAGAINCADDLNLPTCRSMDISAYPTLFYFPYNSPGRSAAERYKSRYDGVEKLENGLLDYVMADAAAQEPVEWPVLDLLEDDETLANLWYHEKGLNVDNIAVVFDELVEKIGKTREQEKVLSYKVVLDLSRFQDQVFVRRASSHHQLAIQHNIKEFPALLLFTRQKQDEPVFTSHSALDRKALVFHVKRTFNIASPKMLMPSAEVKKVDVAGSDVGAGDGPIDGSAKEDPPPKDRVYLADILSGLSYAFRHDIAAQSLIEGERLDALKSFVSVLAKYLPGPKDLHSFLGELDSFVAQQTQRISVDAWSSNYDRIQTKYNNPIPSTSSYIGCRGSQPQFRGYPCTLWTLFHTLTVSAYKEEGKPDVLIAMKRFILNFFGCTYCAENFKKESETMESEVKSRQDAVLWLWEMHNRVNKRLSGSETDDPSHQKLQFPPTSLCPACRGQRAMWNQDRVLAFLLEHYTDVSYLSTKFDSSMPVADDDPNKNIVPYEVSSFDKKGDKKVEQKTHIFGNEIKDVSRAPPVLPKGKAVAAPLTDIDRDLDPPRSLARSFWSNLDLSMCFVLWLASVTLIAFVCFVLRFRRRGNRYKQLAKQV